MSAQCARLTANATTAPSTNTGRTAFTSGRWLPPISGRLRNHTSPEARRSLGTRFRNSRTVKLITPMCMGMSRPCAMRWPSASVSAEERSPASRSSGERAERMTTSDISSAVAVKRIANDLQGHGIHGRAIMSRARRCRDEAAASAPHETTGDLQGVTVNHVRRPANGDAIRSGQPRIPVPMSKRSCATSRRQSRIDVQVTGLVGDEGRPRRHRRSSVMHPRPSTVPASVQVRQRASSRARRGVGTRSVRVEGAEQRPTSARIRVRCTSRRGASVRRPMDSRLRGNDIDCTLVVIPAIAGVIVRTGYARRPRTVIPRRRRECIRSIRTRMPAPVSPFEPGICRRLRSVGPRGRDPEPDRHELPGLLGREAVQDA